MNSEEQLRELLGRRGGVGPPVGAPPWVQVNLAHASGCAPAAATPSQAKALSESADRPLPEGLLPAPDPADLLP